jgi:hypothetical protein
MNTKARQVAYCLFDRTLQQDEFSNRLDRNERFQCPSLLVKKHREHPWSNLRVVTAGFISFSDYVHRPGCRRGVDEFFHERQLPYKLHKVDCTAQWFLRE